MLDKQLQSQKEMQGAGFGHEQQMQQGMFNQQTAMQQKQQAFQGQESQFAHERKMLASTGTIAAKAKNPSRTQGMHTALSKTHTSDASDLNRSFEIPLPTANRIQLADATGSFC